MYICTCMRLCSSVEKGSCEMAVVFFIFSSLKISLKDGFKPTVKTGINRLTKKTTTAAPHAPASDGHHVASIPSSSPTVAAQDHHRPTAHVSRTSHQDASVGTFAVPQVYCSCWTEIYNLANTCHSLLVWKKYKVDLTDLHSSRLNLRILHRFWLRLVKSLSCVSC